jgi:hypothetical protein
MKKNQYVILAIVGIALYLISTGISYAVFNLTGTKTGPSVSEKNNVSLSQTAQKPQKHFSLDA